MILPILGVGLGDVLVFYERVNKDLPTIATRTRRHACLHISKSREVEMRDVTSELLRKYWVTL